ncbi:MAG: hypothetical protein WDM78_07075 [Puia sp.]
MKPLFSFAGQGVVIDIKKEDILSIKDPSNWILQRKVNYASVIQTPDDSRQSGNPDYVYLAGWRIQAGTRH